MRVKQSETRDWREVWLITEWRDGVIYKTEQTHKYIKCCNVELLDPQKYTTSPVPTALSRRESCDLDEFELSSQTLSTSNGVHDGNS